MGKNTDLTVMMSFVCDQEWKFVILLLSRGADNHSIADTLSCNTEIHETS